MSSSRVMICIIGFCLCASNATAQNTDERVYEFLKSVACQRMPFASCDALDPENARNVYRMNSALFRERFCGTRSLSAAKQLVGSTPEVVPDLGACSELISIGQF